MRDGRIEGLEIERKGEREGRRSMRERRNVLVCRVSSLGMLGEGGDVKKEKTWDKDREGERIVWSCWVNS
jgi:hypothetical protein